MAKTGEILGLMGPLGPSSSTHAGRLVYAPSVEMLPEGVIYWTKKEGGEWRPWEPVSDALKKAEAWRTEKAAIRNEKLAKRRRRRDFLLLLAFREGKVLEQVEAEHPEQDDGD